MEGESRAVYGVVVFHSAGARDRFSHVHNPLSTRRVYSDLAGSSESSSAASRPDRRSTRLRFRFEPFSVAVESFKTVSKTNTSQRLTVMVQNAFLLLRDNRIIILKNFFPPFRYNSVS